MTTSVRFDEPPAPRTPRRTRPSRKPFGPGSYMWDAAGLITFAFTNSSAFALQTMHPTVGLVVGEHSTFRTDALGRAKRSIASVLTWVYGGEEALREADRLRELHKPLNSRDEDGTMHHALSSGPWAWIILTAPYALDCAAKYFAPTFATREVQEKTYQEFIQLMRNLYVPEREIPQTYDEYLEVFNRTLEDVLVAHPTTYEYLETVRHLPPPLELPAALHPMWRVLTSVPGLVLYHATVGTLPPRAREKLGLRWTPRDEALLRVMGFLIGRTVSVLPERVRYFPIAYQARKTANHHAKLVKMLDHRPM